MNFFNSSLVNYLQSSFKLSFEYSKSSCQQVRLFFLPSIYSSLSEKAIQICNPLSCQKGISTALSWRTDQHEKQRPAILNQNELLLSSVIALLLKNVSAMSKAHQILCWHLHLSNRRTSIPLWDGNVHKKKSQVLLHWTCYALRVTESYIFLLFLQMLKNKSYRQYPLVKWFGLLLLVSSNWSEQALPTGHLASAQLNLKFEIAFTLNFSNTTTYLQCNFFVLVIVRPKNW